MASYKHDFKSSGYVCQHALELLDKFFLSKHISFCFLNAGLVYTQLWYSFPVQEIKPKKDNTQRNMLVSMIWVQRKTVRMISESRYVLTSQRKSIWWAR